MVPLSEIFSGALWFLKLFVNGLSFRWRWNNGSKHKNKTMKNKIKKWLLVLAVSGAAQWCFAQPQIHRVIILNEGHYDYVNAVQTVPVTMGAYDPVTHIYTQVGTVNNARFATDVIIDGSSIYAAADSFIIRYDIDSYQVLATAILPGVRKLAIWNNQLMATRGEYQVTYNSYFSVFDKTTLQPVYSLPSTAAAGPQYASEGIVVANDKAYIAINNGFEWGNEKGLIGTLDLQTQSYTAEIDLGPTGKNPEYVALLNNQLFTVNNRDFSAASISSVDLTTSNVNTVDLGITNGCGGSVLAVTNIFYQPSGNYDLRTFSTSSMTNTGTLPINKNLYGMGHDEVNNLLYAGETDFVTWGKVFIYQLNGTAVDSFDVGVSPGHIAFDVRDASLVDENKAESNLSIYPNPVTNEFQISDSRVRIVSIEIYNTLGEIVYSQTPTSPDASGLKPQSVNVSSLLPGVYMLSVKADGKLFTQKIVKY